MVTLRVRIPAALLQDSVFAAARLVPRRLHPLRVYAPHVRINAERPGFPVGGLAMETPPVKMCVEPNIASVRASATPQDVQALALRRGPPLPQFQWRVVLLARVIARRLGVSVDVRAMVTRPVRTSAAVMRDSVFAAVRLVQ